MKPRSLSTKSLRDRTALVRMLVGLCLVGLVVLSSGCVRRRLNVRTNPPGALVYVDNQLIGETPCGVDFTYYGTREIRVVKAGFEPMAINQPIPTPWYQFPPLDFVSENLWPARIRDNRTVVYELHPEMITPPHELIQRGEMLRRDTQGPLVQPVGAVAPPVAAPPATGQPILAPPPGAPPF